MSKQFFEILKDKWDTKIGPVFELAAGSDGATVISINPSPNDADRRIQVTISAEPNAMQAGLLEGVILNGSVDPDIQRDVAEVVFGANKQDVLMEMYSRAQVARRRCP